MVGTLSKGGGSFKIDHPLDPENKYLYHSFVESPDMMNIYNGVVTLDETGQAEVELPDYFSALNRDFRYQFTAAMIRSPHPHCVRPTRRSLGKASPEGRRAYGINDALTAARQSVFHEESLDPENDRRIRPIQSPPG
ncbi:MAG: hypothetical protein ACREEM_38400 [Blastocatellia bacterium]